MMRYLNINLLPAVAAALTALLTACTPAADRCADRLDIIVSIEPQRAILEEIGGDRVEVTTLLAGGADPETFDPTMASMMRLERADAWMQIGNVAFEEALEERLGSRGPLTVDTSEGVELLGGHSCGHNHDNEADGHEGHHHHHDDADPHTWSSIVNLKILASNMLRTLTALAPADSAYFAGRHKLLEGRLDSIDRAYRERLTPVRGQTFMVWHPSLSYFARDYGLTQKAVSADHREPSILELKEVISDAKEEGIDVFITQRSFDPRIAATISRQIGTLTQTFDPLDYHWEAELDSVVAALSRRD